MITAPEELIDELYALPLDELTKSLSSSELEQVWGLAPAAAGDERDGRPRS